MNALAQTLALDKNLNQFHTSEVARIQRAVAAKQLGLPPEQFALPFPATQTTINNTTKTGGGWLGPLLATAIAATGLGAAWFLSRPAVPPVVNTVTVPGQSWDSKVKVEVLPPEEKEEAPPVPAPRQ